MELHVSRIISIPKLPGIWVRNDFDLAGIPGFTGTIGLGEAYNTPGTSNQAYVPPPEMCGDPFTPFLTFKATALPARWLASEVAMEGVVVGDFQNNASRIMVT